MVYAQTWICSRKWDAKNSLGFWDTNRSPNPAQTTRHCDDGQQKKKDSLPYSIITTNHKVRIKESKRRSRYLKLAKELRKSWNTRVTVISIVISTLGMVSKGLEKELEELEIGGLAETTQATWSLRTTRIQRRIYETWEELSLWLHWNTRFKIMIIIIMNIIISEKIDKYVDLARELKNNGT